MSRHTKIILQGCIFIVLFGPPLAYKFIKWVEGMNTGYYEENVNELLKSK